LLVFGFFLSPLIGEPTYPAPTEVLQSAIEYFQNTINEHSAVSYGNPQGDLLYREQCATALNKWYQLDHHQENENSDYGYRADDVLFTQGGAAALNFMFNVLNDRQPNGLIVCQFPYYPLYKTIAKDRLFGINCFDAPDCRLTAQMIDDGIQRAYEQAKQTNRVVSAFMLCDPNNPVGTAMSVEEYQQLAVVIRKYPDLMILLDEAYAELRYDLQRVSLISVAPDLVSRIVLMRSGTKGFSLAGERLAILATQDSLMMEEILAMSANMYAHVSRSIQHMYAGNIFTKDTRGMKQTDELE
jgi:aspartate aminotransferase/aminotransferase